MILSSFDFLLIIAAVIFGNAVCALWGWAMWRITRYERAFGLEKSKSVIPFHLYVAVLVAPAVAGAGAWLLLP